MRRVFISLPLFLLIFGSACAFNHQDIVATPSQTSTPFEDELPTLPPSKTATATLAPTQTPTITPTMSLTREWINEEIKSGKEQLEMIIQAIEQYYEDTGAYPESLDALIPDYLDEIPLTITGQQFEYGLFDHYIYIVKFEIARKRNPDTNSVWLCGYIRSSDLWECSGTHR
ncbi:MAG: hypothetical protein JXB38_13445 [Anaerolineales bacterium]|nr:hypothetical protein [Anaerolineales bacterium]